MEKICDSRIFSMKFWRMGNKERVEKGKRDITIHGLVEGKPNLLVRIGIMRAKVGPNEDAPYQLRHYHRFLVATGKELKREAHEIGDNYHDPLTI